MNTVLIRKSGSAKIISLPKAIADMLSLDVGSKLELSVQNNKILLSPVSESLTLEGLLEGTSRKDYALDEEGQEWMDLKPVGREV
ncbi:MAG: AbrB/MazE/SpoVT family DNA-binding domain-containing protein [Gammaproteobacteria bacterium]|nr:AbrB/MazE/SpoVT family DNA-binding domain-containing protein [Gammaproteobacteria bacterium]MBL4729699.1 AbrB/MazE/SpoVT family DNA-binding domain-containing protein [Gammaproteobacteria bacterium]